MFYVLKILGNSADKIGGMWLKVKHEETDKNFSVKALDDRETCGL